MTEYCLLLLKIVEFSRVFKILLVKGDEPMKLLSSLPCRLCKVLKMLLLSI